VDRRQQQQATRAAKKSIIPVLVKVLDLNDNAPKFSQPVYTVQVNELAPAGTVILDQLAYAVDLDSANNGQVEYRLLGGAPGDLSSRPPAGSVAIKSIVPPKSAPVVASQRLVQRAEPQQTQAPAEHGPYQGAATLLAAPTTGEVASSANGESGALNTRPPPPSSTSQSAVQSTATDRVVGAAAITADAPTTSTPAADTDEDEEEPAPAQPPSAPAQPRAPAEPTINLNGEPILNGPMDEPDEDESDEALLASMNAAAAGNSSDSEGEQPPPVGDQSDFASARAFRPRWGTVGGQTASNSATRSRLKRTRRQTPRAGLTTRAPPQFEAAGSTPEPPPWTNLMVIAGEDMQSVEATGNGGGGGKPPEVLLDNDAVLPSVEADDSAGDDELFELELAPQTGRPVIRLKRPLDYETKRLHKLTLIATDRATNKSERLSSRATILVRVLDGDDQPPAFILDQVGCATGLVPQATSPLPPAASSDQADDVHGPATRAAPMVVDLLQQEANERRRLQTMSASQPSTAKRPPTATRSLTAVAASPEGDLAPASTNQRLKSFKVTDENFDFGDTLGLDDVPLDQSTADRLAGDDLLQTMMDNQQSMAGQQARNRRIAASRGRLSTPAASPKPGPPSSPAAASQLPDYSCLGAPLADIGAAAGRQTASGGQHLAEYFATVISGDTDYVLRVAPQSIKARDRDELNAPIRYSFINGTPANYSHYFQLDPLDATIKQVAPIERTQLKEFTLFIQAQEQSHNRLFSVARLSIEVLPTDKNPPVLVPNSYSGYVDENSPLGSRVSIQPPGDHHHHHQNYSTSSRPPGQLPFMRISVLDEPSTAAVGAHRDEPPPTTVGDQRQETSVDGVPKSAGHKQAKYEFETTSDAFKVDRDGFVYVNKFPLDRDAPGQAVHMFQVTARQVGLVSARSISSPISLNITLGDLNDNPPQLRNSTLGPIQMTANSRGGAQRLTQIEALDKDLPENSRMHFSIQHVSNMGSHRFRIDEESGRIEALGKFQAGEQFSLTVQVADELGRSSQGIVDVQVVPGANTGGPQFVTDASNGPAGHESSSSGVRSNEHRSAANAMLARSAAYYSVEVNEGVPVNSAVLQVRAVDPENDPITYSIIDGNINNDFSINSRTGTLSVANKLDREEISAYVLIVQARDSGGLATSRPVHVLITDSNDQNPVFAQEHYVFAVEEGVPGPLEPAGQHGHLLGRVSAHDGDDGDNGRITYSLVLLDSSSSSAAAPSAHPIGGGPPYATPEPAAPTNHSSPSTRQPEGGGGLFSIEPSTGDIRLLRPLDYELAKSHTLLVVARDNGETPRSSSAMVQVRVIDRQDETPYFERYHLEARLDENQPNQRVALVQARDPDSVAEVSYVLVAGDASLFRVDPQTGLISTTDAGLDFEQARFHSLLIGTNESLAAGLDLAAATRQLNDAIAAKQAGLYVGADQQQQQQQQTLDRSPLVRVDVLVSDLNDNAPQFESGELMMPIRVQDSVALGSTLAVQVRAHDSDGSAPNNQVRYELVTSANSNNQAAAQQFTTDGCAQLFLVDPASGQISVRADLKRDPQSECQLIIRARDLPQDGRQSLSSLVSLTVHIDHMAEIAPSSMVGFADSSYTVELPENSPANTLVKLLTIINKPKSVAFPMSCEILSGNELSRFYVKENEQRDCELRTRDHLLDFEQRPRFTLMIKLNTVGGSSSRTTLAQVQVNLVDQNDNRPVFATQPARYNQLTQNKYLAAVAYDSPPDTQVIQLRATDLDSSQANGLVSYELLASEPELEARFKIDPVDGIVRTGRPIEDIPHTRLPIKLRVLARDNPERPADSLESVAEVVVNLIDDHHRIALVLKDAPASRVLDHKEELLAVIQERTGLISGLERVESLKVQKNLSSIETDLSGTDVWFYLIEPGSLRIVPNDDPRLKGSLFEARAQNSLADIINENLGLTKARIRLPYALTNALNGGNGLQSGPSNLLFGAIRANSEERLAPVLILVSLFIAIISALVVIYQCGSVAGFSESANSQQQQQQQQQQHQLLQPNFAKEKFLFSPPPPPPAPSQFQFAAIGSTMGAADGSQTPLGTLSRGYSSGHDQYALTGSSFGPTALGASGMGPLPLLGSNNNNNRTACDPQQLTSRANKELNAIQAKEYETQMLKMSVLFDDSHSFDEQNLNENYNIVNKNLV
jgi:protocadherin-15